MAHMWQQTEIANQFVEQRRHFPCIDFLFDAALRVIRDIGRAPGRIVDLGCGSGVTGGALLDVWPDARLVAVDFSPPMLEKARQAFAGRPNVSVVEGDLADRDLMRRIADDPVDVVISSFAIHHIARADQRALYADVLEVLGPGGVFVNIEHVASGSPRLEAIYWNWFYDHVTAGRNAAGDPVSRDRVRAEVEQRQHVNILTDPFVQATWLRELGYLDVDVPFKSFEMAVLCGYRPA